MRRLIVMRHAKSAWDTDAPSDHDRPLNRRGQRDAPRVARRLVQLGWLPDYVISSDSQRTRETWSLMEEVFAQTPRVDYTEHLYHGGAAELSAALAIVDGQLTTALALGHNPGWQQVVHWLSGESVPLTTANAALLEIDHPTWRAALQEAGSWRLVDVVRPKEL